MPSDSVISVAIGVVRASGTSEPLVSIAPSITSPVIISWYGSPEPLETSWERPERPARALDVEDLDAVVELGVRATSAWNARAVVSQPPPAAAGAMIESWRVGIRLRRVVAAGGPARSDDRDERRDREQRADDGANRVAPHPRNPCSPEAPSNYPCAPCPGHSPAACLALVLAACGGVGQAEAHAFAAQTEAPAATSRPSRRQPLRPGRGAGHADRPSSTPPKDELDPREDLRRDGRHATAARSRSRSTPSARRRPAARSSLSRTRASTTAC